MADIPDPIEMSGRWICARDGLERFRRLPYLFVGYLQRFRGLGGYVSLGVITGIVIPTAPFFLPEVSMILKIFVISFVLEVIQYCINLRKKVQVSIDFATSGIVSEVECANRFFRNFFVSTIKSERSPSFDTPLLFQTVLPKWLHLQSATHGRLYLQEHEPTERPEGFIAAYEFRAKASLIVPVLFLLASFVITLVALLKSLSVGSAIGFSAMPPSFLVLYFSALEIDRRIISEKELFVCLTFKRSGDKTRIEVTSLKRIDLYPLLPGFLHPLLPRVFQSWIFDDDEILYDDAKFLRYFCERLVHREEIAGPYFRLSKE